MISESKPALATQGDLRPAYLKTTKKSKTKTLRYNKVRHSRYMLIILALGKARQEGHKVWPT